MNETKALARIVYGLDDGALTPERTKDIRYKLLDWLGCAAGSVSRPAAAGLLRSVKEEENRGSGTVLGAAGTYPLLTAAFLNGAISHILECDDVHKSAITHPGVVAITSALVAVEYTGGTFRDFALAVIAGYEVMIRLGNALNPSHYDYWHTTGTCGAFAAAAAAGKVFGLDPGELENAFGFAATMASGLTCVFGTDAKLINVGNAVRNGIQAALLSRAGLGSCPDVLERDHGYAFAVSARPDLGAVTEARDGWMIDTAYYKLYASCAHTHSALDAFFLLQKARGFSPESIREIRVRAYSKAAELIGSLKTDSAAQAKFSLPYCLAAAAVRGMVSVRQFEPEALNDPEIRDLARRITVQAESGYDLEYPRKRIETVTVYLKDGQVLEKTVELPEGRPGTDFLEKKFRLLSTLTMDGEASDRLRDQVLALAPDCSLREQIKRWKECMQYVKLDD